MVKMSLKNQQEEKIESKKDIQDEMALSGPGLIEPDMELFCKAAADGSNLGDCPFTHFIQVGTTRIVCMYHAGL